MAECERCGTKLSRRTRVQIDLEAKTGIVFLGRETTSPGALIWCLPCARRWGEANPGAVIFGRPREELEEAPRPAKDSPSAHVPTPVVEASSEWGAGTYRVECSCEWTSRRSSDKRGGLAPAAHWTRFGEHYAGKVHAPGPELEPAETFEQGSLF